ncbi:MAG: phosphatase PAP2 family protein [Bradyrhizobiaceae bacterium]|nr:phosphatase PAP2 family protein [Bradyrhizobiaceae bacterium]
MTATGVKHRALPAAGKLRRIGSEFVALLGLPARKRRRMAGAPMLPATRGVLALLLAAVFIGAAMFVLDNSALARQKRVPIWVIDLFNAITDYGRSGWFLWPSGILIIALALLVAMMQQRFARLTIISLIVRLEFMFIAIALPGLVGTIVKHVIGRVRPSAVGPFAYVPFTWRAEYASMPSGHATTAFAVAVAFGALWPRARPLLWIYALAIAASRVIIAAHYPSDVVAGACLGGFGALLIRNYFAARHLGFAAAPDGTVLRLPGPSLRRISSTFARLFAPAS